MNQRITFMAVMMLCVATGALAQTSEPVAVPAQAEQDAVINAVDESVSAELDENGMVSLDFRDADIKNVLKVLAYKSGVNIIAGPEVVGVVNIQLKDVPWQRALDVILATYGYGYERKENIITVTTIENLKKRREDAQILAEQEPLTTRPFVLSFSKAQDVIGSIEKMVTERGSINFDTRTNTLIVRDTQTNIDVISEVIDRLDTITPQILIEAKIVKTVLDDDETLGIDWGTTLAASGASRDVTWPFVLTSSNQRYLPGTMDVADLTYTAGKLNASGLSATLKMLSTRVDTEVLSNPTIVTTDNKTAKIVVGQEYPIPSYTYNEDSGDLQVDGFTWREIGVVFEVTPHVNGTDYITLDVKPEVSATADTGATFNNDTIPIIVTEEAETSVMIRDGETLMIAGLISNTNAKTVKKVPFLGDIPFLGKIFQQKIDGEEKTELVIFITPRIITPMAK